MTLAFALDRTVEIRARPATVFRFFTDPARWARWWGEGSTIDPVIGGAVAIVYPGGERVAGTIREIEPDRRLVFTFGYEAAGRLIAAGGSIVTITLDELPGGITRLVLRHEVDSAAARDAHGQGWRYQLARFADVVTEEAYAGAREAIAAWFAGWNELDGERRRALLTGAVTEDVRFCDAYGDVYGFDELLGHIAALQRFVPGHSLEVRGTLRRRGDLALVDWAAVRADGVAASAGTNIVRFAVDGRIASVVGVT
jgi:uncharacterized protein YndB with AHSA1/START domain